ncbi:MAG: TraB/GumN family protein [Alteraurantiacibacter sp. bin_em_oilr2.035]|nr:TraB/GumN family protein [Alteraurantiacibacter sp. bin_em_oilr2.035]
MLKRLILTASALTLSACAFPETTLANEAGAHEHGAVEQSAVGSSGPAIWQLGDEDTTIYLFGTVHFLPEGLDWYKPAIADALSGADQFVTEIDTSTVPQMEPGEPPSPEAMAMVQLMIGLAQLETGGTLRDLMTEEDRVEYEAGMTALGLPPQTFDGFEPWFAIMNMAQIALMQAGMDPSTGVERVLDEQVEGKDRAAFETVEQQFGFFDGLPMESQLLMLDESVEALPDMGPGLQALIDEWMDGDADGLAALMNEEMSDPVLYDVLLTSRNSNWAEWIEQRLEQPGTVFIAVGAGHLAGEGSVQQFLAERGISTERVAY